MTDLQLALTIGIPSLLILLGMVLDRARFRGLEAKIAGIELQLKTMRGDLRHFYRDLGWREAEIVSIRDRNRPS